MMRIMCNSVMTLKKVTAYISSAKHENLSTGNQAPSFKKLYNPH